MELEERREQMRHTTQGSGDFSGNFAFKNDWRLLLEKCFV